MFITLKTLLSIGALFALSAVSMPQGQPPANLIHVEITGFHNDKGQALCSIFSSAPGFPKDSGKAAARAKSEISSGRAVCEFSAISPGTYAVAVFHDENSNGKLDVHGNSARGRRSLEQR